MFHVKHEAVVVTRAGRAENTVSGVSRYGTRH